ncbi:hypothetical protein F5B22DRAFT_607456 [Xylaria bambusicola]|uniref:uncharacterized protein n=1 Tax=Xylaria bambusicola TaxID=326684 RepID=UPI002007FEE4|nr:uncharacterized protein F5B22DRAFT_607456 [Xylaria bambusicola]KAI0515475.1 hypothetical protein F5B22DRAFT_607456 [Xylaria bambusicola]
MRHMTGLITPARALHRVLVLELANTTAKSSGSGSGNALLFSSPILPSHAARTPCRLPRRLFSSTPAAHKAPPKKTFLQNMDIPYHWVRVVDENGVLSAPQSLVNTIIGLPDGHNLVMVAPPPESPPSDTAVVAPPAAICRVENTEVRRRLAKEAAAREKAEKPQSKTLEINWTIAKNDLAHKMAKLKTFLEKGFYVEIMLARKKGSRPPPEGTPVLLVNEIREHALRVQGASEVRKMDGRMGGVLKLFFEGPKVAKKVKNKDKYKKDGNGNGNGEEI